ncbi:PDZ and LIM domain protein 3 isoform X9 [Wyeomyia smithii]|uniref:PDZ and LIM domain protein 3 isoform X9 n=1 Tax=Wyeomyia smithii TaxID=174621 RepID=UPI002467E744|nr:PDZ and LIM domain protein 3 isoform X9 [Wyeomyia smithii]
MSPKPHDFLVTLRRNSPQIPWGIRLVGGTDLNAPLIITRVQVNSPAQRELLRGDIITKIDQYDARDLAHSDAENLFRNAGNEIKITIRRDDQIALHQSAHQPNGVGAPAPYSPALSPIPLAQPQSQQKPQPHLNFPPPDPTPLLPRVASPLPHGPHAYAAALEHPMNTLPHTVFPKLDASGAYQLPSPYPPAAPYYDESNEAITNQIVHKQFNSPIGLYSDSNIENTVRNTAPQQNQAVPYKKTVVFDPSKSETYRALQEGAGEGLQEVTTPIQPRTFQPNRLVPGKKPNANHPAPQPEYAQHFNSMGESYEKIHQSGSFRRLMYHVLSETDY